MSTVDRPRHDPAPRPTRASDPLADAHEAIARLLDELPPASDPRLASSWTTFRARLLELLEREQSIVRRLRTRRAPEGDGTRRPSQGSGPFLRTVVHLLDEAERYPADAAAWSRIMDDLADVLTWTFLAHEEELAGD